jgi:glycosyltransferase involved in cell wall biosynthesis
MLCWIVQIGEPLSWIDSEVRPGRYNQLTRALVKNGHHVVWWCSCFEHFQKCYRYPTSVVLHPEKGVELRLLHAHPSYRRSISLARLWQQKALARKFASQARQLPPPDVILAAIPTPELAANAVAFGHTIKCPVLVDIRDLWPDVYLTGFPQWLRPLARGLLTREYNAVRKTLAGASAITGVSQSYVDWGLLLAGRDSTSNDKVFPLGSGLESWVRTLDSQPPQKSDRLRFVFAGNLNRSCDTEALAEAARLLSEQGQRKVELVVAGSGDGLRVLERAAGSLPNVTLKGWLEPAAVTQLLCAADVGLLLYSRGAMQSLPNKFYDYLACGLPLISSLEGEAAELIKREGIGLNYAAGDPGSLATSICWMAEHPQERAAFRERGRNLFAARYQSAGVYQRFVEHLSNLKSAQRLSF